jgi:hypothetical protein
MNDWVNEMKVESDTSMINTMKMGDERMVFEERPNTTTKKFTT